MIQSIVAQIVLNLLSLEKLDTSFKNNNNDEDILREGDGGLAEALR